MKKYLNHFYHKKVNIITANGAIIIVSINKPISEDDLIFLIKPYKLKVKLQ